MRILISAFYCSPYLGSESAVGWQIVSRVAERHDVTVLCGDLSKKASTRTDLERRTNEGGIPDGLRVEYVAPTRPMLWIIRLHSLPGMWTLFYVAYRMWQKKAYRRALELHAEEPFDLSHQTTVIGFREPGFLWKLPIPFLWGPVSGASAVPSAFTKHFSPAERFRWTTHHILNRLQVRSAHNARRAAKRAACVWAVTPEDLRMFERWGIAARPLLETAGPTELRGKVRAKVSGEPLRVCWSGQFQGRKCLFLLLHAVAELPDLSLEIEILGDGPEAASWKRLADHLNLGYRLRWHGMLPREDALALMNSCHVFVHTSVKEATSTVVLEALALGLPVICHDSCGMGTAITDTCGIKIPLASPERSIDGFQEAIRRFHNANGLLKTRSEGALERSKELSWNVKVEEILDGYREAAADA